MGLVFDIKSDIEKLSQNLTELQQNQMPRVIVTALNQTISSAQRTLREQMKQAFDRPSPYTVRGVIARFASISRQEFEASVFLANETTKGVPVERYLSPEVRGGARSLKSGEKQLQARGVLPAGKFIAPGPSARLDAYGNIPGSKWTQVLSAFGALSERGYNANRTGASAKRRRNQLKKFFVVSGNEAGVRLKPGIYERDGSRNVLRIMQFIKAPTYKPRYDFDGIAKQVAETEFNARFSAAFASLVSRV